MNEIPKNLKLEAALKYAAMGMSIIPTGLNKVPLLNWKPYQDRCATMEEINNWWKTWPDANPALVTGKISGVVALDLDKKHNRTLGEFPIQLTACAKSGNGGEHAFFKYPSDASVKSGSAISGEGVDCRGDGGYILLASSVNETGGKYEWTIPLESRDDLAEMPDWFKKLTTTSASDKKWLSGKDGVSEGARNDTAASMAGKIISSTAPELLESIGWEQIKVWNGKNVPPISEVELRSVWDSIVKCHAGNIQEESVFEQCDILLSGIPKNIPNALVLKALAPLFEILAASVSQEEAEMYIRSKIKSELALNTKDVDLITKSFKKTRMVVSVKIEKERKIKEQLNEDQPLSEKELQIAERKLKSPTLLYDILKMVKRLGVVGEEQNVLLHYIIFTSRKLRQPLSATVKGDSSSGKSYTLLTTIKLFPKSAYIDLTDATPQSFYYCPENYFKNKIIVLFEKHGGERADYAIRTLQSEGKLKIQVTTKNVETGQFEAQTIEKEGPTGFVTTTTASTIHAENDTRNISMFPDQSSEQTSRVYGSVDSRYLGIPPISDDELKPWHYAQLALEQLPVYIPFVESFRKHFPNHITRTRRDYGHFLAILETVAFLHQKQRERIELNGQSYIRAILADAYMAKVIVEEALSKSIYELPEKTMEIIEIAKMHVKESKEEQMGMGGDSEVTFSKTELAKKSGWDRDTVEKWMKPANKKGYFTVVVPSRGSKGAEYKLEEKDLPGNTFLPSAEDLFGDNPSEGIENIYNPLTGESISLNSESKEISTDAPTVLEGVQNEGMGQKNTTAEAIGTSVVKPFEGYVDPKEAEEEAIRKTLFDYFPQESPLN